MKYLSIVLKHLVLVFFVFNFHALTHIADELSLHFVQELTDSRWSLTGKLRSSAQSRLELNWEPWSLTSWFTYWKVFLNGQYSAFTWLLRRFRFAVICDLSIWYLTSYSILPYRLKKKLHLLLTSGPVLYFMLSVSNQARCWHLNPKKKW